MKPAAKWLFTAIGLTFAAVGVLAIMTEVHTGSTRRHGIVALFGNDAVWIGQTCLLLAALPLVFGCHHAGWAKRLCCGGWP